MERFVKRDVVIIEFPFSNLIQSKRRPALIIKIPKGDDMIVCQITGKSQEKSVEIPIINEDFKVGGLKRNSFVRMDKFFSIEKSLVKYRAGSLKQGKFNEIIDKICSFLKN